MFKYSAVGIENPNNLGELNNLLNDGYEVYTSHEAKNTVIFILRKYTEDQLHRNLGRVYATEDGVQSTPTNQAGY